MNRLSIVCFVGLYLCSQAAFTETRVALDDLSCAQGFLSTAIGGDVGELKIVVAKDFDLAAAEVKGDRQSGAYVRLFLQGKDGEEVKVLSQEEVLTTDSYCSITTPVPEIALGAMRFSSKLKPGEASFVKNMGSAYVEESEQMACSLSGLFMAKHKEETFESSLMCYMPVEESKFGQKSMAPVLRQLNQSGMSLGQLQELLEGFFVLEYRILD